MSKTGWAMMSWAAGLILVGMGEGVGAFDGVRGNTISEKWDNLPQPAKYFTIFALGATFGHWCWPMPQREVSDVTVNINPKDDDNAHP